LCFEPSGLPPLKNFQSSQEKRQIPLFPPAKLHTIFFEDPQNDKKKNKKLWNFKILKQKTLKIHKSKAPLTPLTLRKKKNP
jgi:hypothetical protein